MPIPSKPERKRNARLVIDSAARISIQKYHSNNQKNASQTLKVSISEIRNVRALRRRQLALTYV